MKGWHKIIVIDKLLFPFNSFFRFVHASTKRDLYKINEALSYSSCLKGIATIFFVFIAIYLFILCGVMHAEIFTQYNILFFWLHLVLFVWVFEVASTTRLYGRCCRHNYTNYFVCVRVLYFLCLPSKNVK